VNVFFRKNGKLLLLLLALLLMLGGVLLGEPDLVWQKAKTICLECCGIG
jgi:hypothetical protein